MAGSRTLKIEIVGDAKDAAKAFGDAGSSAGKFETDIDRADGAMGKFNSGSSKAMKDVARETDNTRSVVANFAGNAVTELPGIGAAMGPMNMAIGQFGEYAAEGNIKLSKFVAAGAGIALAGVAMQGLAEGMKALNGEEAFNSDQVEAYTDALEDAGSAVDAVKAKLEAAGKVEWRVVGDKVVDITEKLASAGVTATEFAKIVAGGQPAIQEFGEAMLAAGADAGDMSVILAAAEQQALALGEAEEIAAAKAKFFGTEARDAAAGADVFAAALKGAEQEAATLARQGADVLAFALEGLAVEEENARDKADEATQAHINNYNAVLARIDAEAKLRGELVLGVGGQAAYEQTLRDTRVALEGYNEQVADGTLKGDALDTATFNVSQKMLAAAEAYAESEGAAKGSDEQVRLMTASLQMQAGALEPGSPVRNALGGYITELGDIPDEILTTFGVVIKGQNVKVTPTGDFKFDGSFKGGIAGATGGVVTRPTYALIGEAGPEAVIPLNQAPGASPLPAAWSGASGSPVVVNVIVEGSVIQERALGQTVYEQLQRLGKTNGGLVFS